MWTVELITRLQRELDLLDIKWPGWNFDSSSADQALFVNSMRTNRNNVYVVRIAVTPNFPDTQPRLFVDLPSGAVPQAPSHDFHALHYNVPLGQEVCGYQTWSTKNTILQSALRLREWLEAYDAWRATGKVIASFLD